MCVGFGLREEEREGGRRQVVSLGFLFSVVIGSAVSSLVSFLFQFSFCTHPSLPHVVLFVRSFVTCLALVLGSYDMSYLSLRSANHW